MKHNLKQKGKSPCSVRNMPVPKFVTCPKCGGAIELWSDEDVTACVFCGHKVFKKENIIH